MEILSGEKQLPAGSRGRTAAWNKDSKRNTQFIYTHALDRTAREGEKENQLLREKAAGAQGRKDFYIKERGGISAASKPNASG